MPVRGMGTPPPCSAAAWAVLGSARPYWLWSPTIEAVARVVRGFLRLGGSARPPDQAECAEDRDLQHDQEKENRPEPLHVPSVPAADGPKTGARLRFSARRPRFRGPRIPEWLRGPPLCLGGVRLGLGGLARLVPRPTRGIRR